MHASDYGPHSSLTPCSSSDAHISIVGTFSDRHTMVITLWPLHASLRHVQCLSTKGKIIKCCTYKISNGIQLYNTPWFGCGLLTDDVEDLPNIFLKSSTHFHII